MGEFIIGLLSLSVSILFTLGPNSFYAFSSLNTPKAQAALNQVRTKTQSTGNITKKVKKLVTTAFAAREHDGDETNISSSHSSKFVLNNSTIAIPATAQTKNNSNEQIGNETDTQASSNPNPTLPPNPSTNPEVAPTSIPMRNAPQTTDLTNTTTNQTVNTNTHTQQTNNDTDIGADVNTGGLSLSVGL